MKLLYYVGLGTDKFGGLEKFCLTLFKHLRLNHNDVVLVYARPIEVQSYLDNLRDIGVKIYILRNKVLSYGQGRKEYKRMRQIMHNECPDIFHGNFMSSKMLLMAKSACLFRRCIFVNTEHCDPSIKNRNVRLDYRIKSLFNKKMLGVSKAIASHMNAVGVKAVPLYLGVPANPFDRLGQRTKYGFKPDEIIISNIAYHHPDKGVDILLKAIDYLKNTLHVNNFKLLQIGGQPFSEDASTIKTLFYSLDIADCVSFVGVTSEIPQILKACDIYCQPSRSEGIPLSIMEASMAELPIVATSVGGIPEAAVDGENAFLVERNDYKAIANSLKKLIENPELRRRMGVNGRTLALERFDIENQIKLQADLYEQVL